MKCIEARPLFPLYLDSAVTGVEMHALSAHMSACPECQSEYKEMENTRLLVTSLGRKPSNAIVLDDDFISGEHSLVSWRDGRAWLEDVASTNGTFLNDATPF